MTRLLVALVALVALAALAAGCVAPGRAPVSSHASWTALPAPHRLPAGSRAPALHGIADLRALVGRRDPRDSLAAAQAWLIELDAPVAPAVTGADLLAWPGATVPTETAQPGDLLVFDRTAGDKRADLVAMVVAHDDIRGVTEFVYVAGGVVRRGFVDALRPALHRNAAGAVVNTFMRAGSREPPKGTHYLAGELLARVVHVPHTRG